MADCILQFVQGYGFRTILDGPLAVIQLKPNDGLMAVAICAFVISNPPRKAVKAAILCRLNDSNSRPRSRPVFLYRRQGRQG